MSCWCAPLPCGPTDASSKPEPPAKEEEKPGKEEGEKVREDHTQATVPPRGRRALTSWENLSGTAYSKLLEMKEKCTAYLFVQLKLISDFCFLNFHIWLDYSDITIQFSMASFMDVMI